jgi:hypothetical protein
MQQTPALPVVYFRHDRLNYGQPRYVLAKDEGKALVIIHGLAAFFADDIAARFDYAVQVPEHFLGQHPGLTVDQGDEYDLDQVVDYDQDNPEHVAWMNEAREILAQPQPIT